MAAIEDLVKWATDQGALVSPHLSIKQISQDNIGVFYNDTPSETSGEQALDGKHIRIPIKLCLTLSDAVEGLNKAVGEKSANFDDISSKTSNINAVTKLYLARERTGSVIAQSFYKPYLAVLPSLDQINSPYTWNSQDKAALKGTNLGESLKTNLGQLVEEWWQLINMLPESMEKPTSHFINMKFYYEYKFYTDEDLYKYFIEDEDIDNWTSFGNYLWASLILKSRSFPAYLLKDVPGHGHQPDEAMLLPLIDLLNHDSKAHVEWSVDDGFFGFRSQNPHVGELFNNYGMKGNEELLLAYGFCIENNAADSAALKIKIPESIIEDLKINNIKLPSLSDYTTSVVRNEASGETPQEYKDGLLFFITQDNLPENLIQVFQYLVQNEWETGITLRMQLAGINQLRQAIEAKSQMIQTTTTSQRNSNAIRIYTQSQKKIFSANIKKLKHLEKALLSNPEYKSRFITLKNVYKKDLKFQNSLLVSLGVTSYDTILENELQDQCWLLYLIRCYNRDQYLGADHDEEGDDDNYLPEWVQKMFAKLENLKISPAEVVQYRDLYQGLIEPMSKVVPEIYGRGKWGVEELVKSAKLLDRISFVRGKDQECILVEPEQKYK